MFWEGLLLYAAGLNGPGACTGTVCGGEYVCHWPWLEPELP